MCYSLPPEIPLQKNKSDINPQEKKIGEGFNSTKQMLIFQNMKNKWLLTDLVSRKNGNSSL